LRSFCPKQKVVKIWERRERETTYSNTNEELIEVNVTIIVSIEVCQKSLYEKDTVNLTENGKCGTYISFSLGDFNSVFLHANEEFSSVDLSVSVIGIELSESSAESSNGG